MSDLGQLADVESRDRAVAAELFDPARLIEGWTRLEVDRLRARRRSVVIALQPAEGPLLDECCECVRRHHYLHTAPDARTRPFAYVVAVHGVSAGCLFFGRTQSTACYKGELTYGGSEALKSGKAKYDRWEVLNLSRLWFSPDHQRGGRYFTADRIPGFLDRRGVFRSTLASAVVHMAQARIGYDYLLRYPPCFLDQPYRIRTLLSYCNRTLHRGAVYRAAGWHLSRENGRGIQTWWTGDVADLSEEQDESIRAAAQESLRSVRIRNAGRSLFDHPVEVADESNHGEV